MKKKNEEKITIEIQDTLWEGIYGSGNDSKDTYNHSEDAEEESYLVDLEEWFCDHEVSGVRYRKTAPKAGLVELMECATNPCPYELLERKHHQCYCNTIVHCGNPDWFKLERSKPACDKFTFTQGEKE